MHRLLRLIFGRHLWLSLVPAAAAIAVAAIVAALGLAGFTAAPTNSTPAAESNPPVGSNGQGPPAFNVAVGIDDEPVEMAALQSAKTEFLSFPGEFFANLRTTAALSDFATRERQTSPATAKENVESGASVLAIVFPRGVTASLMKDMESVSTGEARQATRIPVTVYVGPQARAQKNFIVDQYTTRALNQSLQFSLSQITTEASRYTCQQANAAPRASADAGGRPCAVSGSQLAAMFDSVYQVTRIPVSGPPAVDYVYPSQQTAAPQHTAASQPAPSAQPAPAATPAPAVTPGVPQVAALVVVTAGLVLGVATALVVDRSVGIGIVGFGPWRRWGRQRPFNRTTVLWAKVGVIAPSAVLTATAAAIWVGTSAPFGPSSPAGSAHAAFALVSSVGLFSAVIVMCALLCVVALDALGALVGGIAVAALSAWLLVPGLRTADSPVSSLGRAVEVVAGSSAARQVGDVAVPAAFVCLLIAVAVTAAGLLCVRAYDHRVSVRISQ